jgi:hypothetical protein
MRSRKAGRWRDNSGMGPRTRTYGEGSRIIGNGLPEPTSEVRDHWVRLVED